MPIPAIFLKDDHTAKLAAYFTDIYAYLVEQGVPEERLPSPWHVLSHVVTCLDSDRVAQWLEAYVALESVQTAMSAFVEEPEAPTPARRPKPAYLRALTESLPSSESPEPSDT